MHEATAFAGGRCRSYHDASVGMTIDNGNHLLLSGNHAALDYLRSIGAGRSAGRSADGGVSLRRSRERRALDAALQRRPIAVLGFRSRPARARNARARLSAAGAAAVGAVGQGGRRGDRLRRHALPAAGRAAAACGTEHRCAAQDPRGLRARSSARRSPSAGGHAGR